MKVRLKKAISFPSSETMMWTFTVQPGTEGELVPNPAGGWTFVVELPPLMLALAIPEQHPPLEVFDAI